MRSLRRVGLLVCVGLLIAITPPARGQVIYVEPPAPRVEVVPPVPYPGAVWAPGYWGWRGRRHVWIDGYYMHPRRGYAWAPYGWVHEGRGWRFHRGGWERR